MNDKIYKIENEYYKKTIPICEERFEVLMGNRDPKYEEFEMEAKNDEIEGNEVGIPNFWLEVLTDNLTTKELIKEHDKELLENLINIELERNDDYKNMSFKLRFIFHQNIEKWFEPNILIKK